jgi:hypothetical protein
MAQDLLVPGGGMAKTILFVHGTGVRAEGYDASLKLIKAQLAIHAKDVGVAECRWGESVGARLSRDGASVPSYGKSRGVGVSKDDELEALWGLLLQDPSFELGLLSANVAKPAAGAHAPNRPQPGKALAEAFAVLPGIKELTESLAAAGLDQFAASALKEIQASAGFKLAEASLQAGEPAHRDALARAFVASLLRAALDMGGPVPDGAARGALLTLVQRLLARDQRGVFALATAPFKGLAQGVATWQIRRKRTSLTDAAYPVAGDILLYQAKGEAIRRFIRDELDKLKNDSVFILAHSLGGVAAFELLVEQRPPQVKAFVTFGSQAPFFHEIGALRSMPAGNEALPQDFPTWINFYDLNDPLSYVGEGIFGKDRMSDYKVESGESFPASHSAYLHGRGFWQHVSAFIAQHA